MYSYKSKKLPKNTLEVTITLEKAALEAEYPHAFSHKVSHLKVQGFRPGKVPESIAKQYISEMSVYEEVVNTLINRAYGEIVKKEAWEPILQPILTNITGKPGEDWVATLKLVLRPDVKLADYKKIKNELLAKQAKEQLSNDKKEEGSTKKSAEENNQALLSEMIDTITTKSTVDFAPELMEHEYAHRMERLESDLKRIGATKSEYLASRNTKEDEFEKKTREDIEKGLAVEYVLGEIARKEGISITDDDLKPLLESAKTPEQKTYMQDQLYSYAVMLQRQKIFDFLSKKEK